jgi:molybdopterin/thiamine biosynthesis adenylyltransferase
MKKDDTDIACRNMGIFSKEEQEKIRTTAVGVAGVGGIGGLLAERLIRIGVGQLRLNDPGLFRTRHLSSQFACTLLSVGEYKVEEIYYELDEINPEAEIICDRAGIQSQDDADRFVHGCSIVVDTMNCSPFRDSVYLQRAARNSKAFYLLASCSGFGAALVTFDPAGFTLEEFMGTSRDADIQSTTVFTHNRVLPSPPSYVQDRMDLMARTAAGEMSLSNNSIGAGLGSLLAANEAVNVVLRKRPLVTAPRYTYVDLLDRVFMDQDVLLQNLQRAKHKPAHPI